MEFKEKVYESVKKIPKGKVATYGQIALMSGSPMASRAVGNILHKNPDPTVIPCHRVVNASGKLAKAFVFGGINEQRIRLEKEGIVFTDDEKVDIKKYLWIF